MNRILLCLLAMLLVWSCSKDRHSNLVIEGRLDSLEADTLIVHDITSFSDTIYKIPVKDGAFRMALPADSNAVLELTDGVSLNSFIAFASRQGVKVSGDMADESTVTVTGGRENELFNSFKAYLTALKDSLAADTSANIEEALRNLAMTFIEKHPVSPVSAFVLERYLLPLPNPDYIRIKEAVDRFTGSVQDMPSMSRLIPVIEKKANASAGKYLPLITVRARTGKFIPVSDFSGKKYCLLQFWASWSPSSRRQNIALDSLVNSLTKEEKKKIEIIGVSLDTDTLLCDKAVREDSIQWRQVCDREAWESALAKRYVVHSLPDNVLVSPEGYVTGRAYGPKELAKEIKDILKKEKEKEKEKKARK